MENFQVHQTRQQRRSQSPASIILVLLDLRPRATMHPTHASITSTLTQSHRCATASRRCLPNSSVVRQILRWRVLTWEVRVLFCWVGGFIWQPPFKQTLVALFSYLELLEQRRRLQKKESPPLPSAAPQGRRPDTLRQCRHIWPYTQTYRPMSLRASWRLASRTFHPISGSTLISPPWTAVLVHRLPTSSSSCPGSIAQRAVPQRMSTHVDRPGFRLRPRLLIRRGVMPVSVWETLSLRQMRMRLSRQSCWRNCGAYSPVCLEEYWSYSMDINGYVIIPLHKMVNRLLLNAIQRGRGVIELLIQDFTVSDCSAFSLRLFIGAQKYRLKYISKWRCRLCSNCGLRGEDESFHPTSQGRCVRESASVMHRAKISWQKAAFVIWKDRGALATTPWYFTKQTSVGSGAVSNLLLQACYLYLPHYRLWSSDTSVVSTLKFTPLYRRTPSKARGYEAEFRGSQRTPLEPTIDHLIQNGGQNTTCLHDLWSRLVASNRDVIAV